MHTMQRCYTIVLPLREFHGKIILFFSFLCSGETAKIENTQKEEEFVYSHAYLLQLVSMYI